MLTFARRRQASRYVPSAKTLAPSRGEFSESHNPAGRLQGAIGNQAMLRLLRCNTASRGHSLQAKLTVSRPGDRHEQEADRVADQVMRMPRPSLQAGSAYAAGGSTPAGSA